MKRNIDSREERRRKGSEYKIRAQDDEEETRMSLRTSHQVTLPSITNTHDHKYRSNRTLNAHTDMLRTRSHFKGFLHPSPHQVVLHVFYTAVVDSLPLTFVLS